MLNKYKTHFCDKRFLLSIALATLLLGLSLVVNFYAGLYANEKASNYVTDIVLNNIPVFNVDLIFVYGPPILWALVALLCLAEPKRIPFILKNIALFVFIRSVFITLTHIGPFPDHATIDYTSDFVKRFTFGGDLFFSAHTGMPFLVALIFHQNRRLFWFFTAASVFFGIVVLLGHLHYTIDVVAAFFITYTIYHLAIRFFPTDYRRFNQN